MSRILWHSNAPWSPTGYGQQTALFTPLLAKHSDLAISSFYGLDAAIKTWREMIVFPGVQGDVGNVSLPAHARIHFNEDLRDPQSFVLTLLDVWTLDADMVAQLNTACWVPVDHDPVPPRVTRFFERSRAIPIAMTRFGAEQLVEYDPLYVPHGVDTEIYKPKDPTEALQNLSLPEDAFLVGMVAANKGRPSRKCFSEALQAFVRFAQNHDNAYLYLHTDLDPAWGAGEDLVGLIQALEIPSERIRVANSYAIRFAPYESERMADLFSAFSVLLSPSAGEGFGIPVLEAQACGTPAIVTDFSAMREVCGAGWKVKYRPCWTGQSSWQASPDVDDIVSALEDCYAMPPGQRQKLSDLARKHAVTYDVHRVLKQHWLPVLAEVERRFEARRPQVLRAAA